MKILLLLLSVQFSDPFEQWLCEQSRRGQLDCQHGSGRCTEIARQCPRYFEPRKRMPKEMKA